MQGKIIIGAILSVLAPSVALAVEVPRQGCARGEAPQQVQRAPERQQQVQQQRQTRNKSEGCPVTRTVPSVVDPVPTYLL